MISVLYMTAYFMEERRNRGNACLGVSREAFGGAECMPVGQLHERLRSVQRQAVRRKEVNPRVSAQVVQDAPLHCKMVL